MSDQLFTTHKHEVFIPKFGIDYKIFPFSDVHYNAPNCDRDKFHRWCDYAKRMIDEMDGRVLFIGVGDYDDMASTSEREYFQKFHSTTKDSLDTFMECKTQEFIDRIKFMKGRLIGMIEGNHYFKFQSGITSTQKMCEALNCKYLGGSSIIRLVFKYMKGSRASSIDIYAHHTAGSKGGGGRRVGSSINKLEDMSHVWFADIYLAGHDHKLNSAHPIMMYLDHHGYVKAKEQLLVRTGSFQKAWEDGREDYVATFNGKANNLSAPMINLIIRLEKNGKNSEFIEIDKSVTTGSFF